MQEYFLQTYINFYNRIWLVFEKKIYTSTTQKS